MPHSAQAAPVRVARKESEVLIAHAAGPVPPVVVAGFGIVPVGRNRVPPRRGKVAAGISPGSPARAAAQVPRPGGAAGDWSVCVGAQFRRIVVYARVQGPAGRPHQSCPAVQRVFGVAVLSAENAGFSTRGAGPVTRPPG